MCSLALGDDKSRWVVTQSVRAPKWSWGDMKRRLVVLYMKEVLPGSPHLSLGTGQSRMDSCSRVTKAQTTRTRTQERKPRLRQDPRECLRRLGVGQRAWMRMHSG
jgi:hypothetical protein